MRPRHQGSQAVTPFRKMQLTVSAAKARLPAEDRCDTALASAAIRSSPTEWKMQLTVSLPKWTSSCLTLPWAAWRPHAGSLAFCRARFRRAFVFEETVLKKKHGFEKRPRFCENNGWAGARGGVDVDLMGTRFCGIDRLAGTWDCGESALPVYK